MGHCKSSAQEKVHSNTGLPQVTRKTSNNNLTLHLNQQLKEEMKHPRFSTRKEIIKIRAEIAEIETRKRI